MCVRVCIKGSTRFTVLFTAADDAVSSSSQCSSQRYKINSRCFSRHCFPPSSRPRAAPRGILSPPGARVSRHIFSCGLALRAFPRFRGAAVGRRNGQSLECGECISCVAVAEHVACGSGPNI